MAESTSLGELEAEVMGIIWERGESSVQDVKDVLAPERRLAYTTVMTVMKRLMDKGLLVRRKEGRAYLYTPADTQENIAGSLLRSFIKRLYDGATAPAIAHLLEAEDIIDEAELDRLERLIQAKRKENKS